MKVQLDKSKLLGFKILETGAADERLGAKVGGKVAQPAPKLGAKVGGKVPNEPTLGLKIGAKVGGKVPGAAVRLGAKVGGKVV